MKDSACSLCMRTGAPRSIKITVRRILFDNKHTNLTKKTEIDQARLFRVHYYTEMGDHLYFMTLDHDIREMTFGHIDCKIDLNTVSWASRVTCSEFINMLNDVTNLTLWPIQHLQILGPIGKILELVLVIGVWSTVLLISYRWLRTENEQVTALFSKIDV